MPTTSTIANPPNIEKSVTEKETTSTTATPSKEPKTKFKSISPKLKDEMIHEINQMLSFALHNGKTVNIDVIPLIEENNIDNLINAHNLLCKNVAPATPKSINYSFNLRDSKQQEPLLKKLPLVRNLIILAIIFLILFVATGQSSMVNDESLDIGVMNNRGLSLLLNLVT